MIITQNQLTLHSYLNTKYAFEDTIQAAFWELVVLSIFDVLVISNCISLYKSIDRNKSKNSQTDDNIQQKQWWYFFNLSGFCIFFTGFISVALYIATIDHDANFPITNPDLNKFHVSKWIEFIFCLLSIVFCFSSHMFYFAYKKTISNTQLNIQSNTTNNNNNEMEIVGLEIKRGEILQADRISEITMFIIFHMILIHVLSNLMYFNFVLNVWVNLGVMVLLEICVVYFSEIDIIGAGSILMIVMLYFIQIYKQIFIAFSTDDQLNAINNANFGIINNLQAQNNKLQSDLNNEISSNTTLQSDITTLTSSLNDSRTISSALRNYQIQSMTIQLNNNLSLLIANKSYLSSLVSIFSAVVTNLNSISPSDASNTYYTSYVGRIGSIINQIDNLISQFQSAINNASNLQNSDITTLNQNLNTLLNNTDFIRSHVFFNTPTAYQSMDSGNFNLLYECYLKIFANFFRVSSAVGWYGNNENVARDMIIYTKKTSTIYNALSDYSKSLVDELYVIIDGDALWTILSGQLTNDNNTSQMNTQILNQSNYGQIYNANGIEYCSLLFELASQSDFASQLNSNVALSNFNWKLPMMMLEDMEQYAPNNFGFVNIQSI